MKDEKDPVMVSVQAVHAALRDLEPEQRRRVLASVGALLDIAGKQAFIQQTDPPKLRSEERARQPSLIEVIQDKKPGTNAQHITLFAYYREKHEGLPRFQRNDLESYFGMAKEAPPTNFDRDFVESVKRGWIHESGNESYITSRGIEAVEAGFEGERKTIRRTKRARKSVNKPKSGK